jgi:uncharacterized protein
MKIVITGASGFVGTALSRFLLDAGHAVTGLGTSRGHPLESVTRFTWCSVDTTRPGAWLEAVGEADTVVNLAGRTLFKRWTRRYKEQLVDSRVRTTRHVAGAMAGNGRSLISASAVGYYGNRGDETLTEQSSPGNDFLARLSVDWEDAAMAAGKRGVRVVIMRLGVVLGFGGGALAQMLPAYRKFVGGPLASGRQWFSWIHMTDLLSAMQFVIEHEDARGVYNFCAPAPVRQMEFARTLGRILGRPAAVPAPSLALRLLLGEFADTLLASQKMVPDRWIAEGFAFRFTDVESALADLIKRP